MNRKIFLFLCLFFAGLTSSGDVAQSPPTAAPILGAAASQAPSATSSSSAAQKKITAYTLSSELYRKAKTLGRIRFSFQIFSFCYALFVLWFILQCQHSARLRDWAESASRKRYLQVLIYAPLLILTMAILQLPLDLFAEILFKHYGISIQSWSSWTGDWLKVQMLAILGGTFLAWLLYAILRRSPRRWWLYFWLLAQPIFLFLFFLQPYVIDPLFNEFQPLSAKAPAIVPQLQRVASRAGMEISPERMFWMKASDKTIYCNAYVTGFGASKRIVIWDTCFASETKEGILVTFGHELGHYALGHVWKGLLFVSLLALLLLFLGWWSIGWLLAKYGAKWRVRSLDDWASLPALLLLITLCGFAAGVAVNGFSRYDENQADIYSLEVTHGIVADPGQASAISFQKYGESVFVDPDPNPAYVFLFFNHPTVTDRVHLFVTYDPWSKGESPHFVK